MSGVLQVHPGSHINDGTLNKSEFCSTVKSSFNSNRAFELRVDEDPQNNR